MPYMNVSQSSLLDGTPDFLEPRIGLAAEGWFLHLYDHGLLREMGNKSSKGEDREKVLRVVPAISPLESMLKSWKRNSRTRDKEKQK